MVNHRKSSVLPNSFLFGLRGVSVWLSVASIQFFLFLVVLLLLFCFSPRSHSARVAQQVAYPAWPVSPIRSVFVDSGSFPHGIYNARQCFTDLDEQGPLVRICGLFTTASSASFRSPSMFSSSSSCGGANTVNRQAHVVDKTFRRVATI